MQLRIWEAEWLVFVDFHTNSLLRPKYYLISIHQFRNYHIKRLLRRSLLIEELQLNHLQVKLLITPLIYFLYKITAMIRLSMIFNYSLELTTVIKLDV